MKKAIIILVSLMLLSSCALNTPTTPTDEKNISKTEISTSDFIHKNESIVENHTNTYLITASEEVPKIKITLTDIKYFSSLSDININDKFIYPKAKSYLREDNEYIAASLICENIENPYDSDNIYSFRSASLWNGKTSTYVSDIFKTECNHDAKYNYDTIDFRTFHDVYLPVGSSAEITLVWQIENGNANNYSCIIFGNDTAENCIAKGQYISFDSIIK